MILTSLLVTVALTTVPDERVKEVLSQTRTLRLTTDRSALTPGEQTALTHLLKVGALFQELYEDQCHPDAAAMRRKLAKSPQPELQTMWRLAQGPIYTTVDNQRAAFVPVRPETPARNVYPPDATREQMDTYLAAHPSERTSLLDEHTVVRRATRENLKRDRQALARSAVLAFLHPGLDERLAALKPDPLGFYAVPQAVAYDETVMAASRQLMAAADAVEADDSELARYLRQRARDLLTNDYEAGDAAWLTGRFKRLNVQIGAYESYDDGLYGVKAFFGLSVMIRDEAATRALQAGLQGLQAVEDALPSPVHKKVRTEIPVGVYNVIADFGQTRGLNTATNLPNNPLFSQRYGRIILMRANVLRAQELFEQKTAVWRAAFSDGNAQDFTSPEGDFQRTLWHEVGHYLGGDRNDLALAEWANPLEELKSDLVALFALHRQKLPAPLLREVQTAGLFRMLVNNRPRPDQPYHVMRLAQLNYFLDRGVLSADQETGRLSIHLGKYADTVKALLEEVLALQHREDPKAAAAFFARWTGWTPLHDKLATRVRAAEAVKYWLVRYEALGE